MPEVTHVLVMRNVPKSVNQKGGGVGMHHMAAHSDKKKWEGLFILELLAARVRKGMEFCDIDLVIRWKHRAGGKGRDEENYRHPITKPLLDAMVSGGYIPDDAPEFVKVHDLRFEYPEEWAHPDPRVKAELVIRLDARYPS